ncbi:MAG: exosome complex protein Rrp42 [Candidatus Diapherotrites archaeon]|nr:exosome complex protein Rrp42 [Candidatus Diapherotrites archaeon]
MSTDILTLLESNKVLDYLNQGKRFDKRKFDEARQIQITTDISHAAEGSARVKLGNTEVICGIKMELGTPYPDSPDEGAMATEVELLSLASPNYEVGPPRDDSIELARVVDRSIRESHCIDFNKLCIKEGERAWVVFMDFYALNYDGNLFDAFNIAGLAALSNTKIPKIDDEAKRKIQGEYSGQLKMHNLPVLNSVAKISNHLVLDPGIAEEAAATAVFHVSLLENDDLNAIQKSGKGYFTYQELETALEMASKNSKNVRKVINSLK